MSRVILRRYKPAAYPMIMTFVVSGHGSSPIKGP
jgi:hypothetical protein